MRLSKLGVLVAVSLMLTTGVVFGQSGEPVGEGQSDGIGVPAGDPVPAPAPAPKIPRTMVDKATIEFDGTALAKGEIVVAVETSTGASHQATVGVVAKMRDKEIAQMLARDLQYAMSKDLEFKVNGNKIKISRVKKDKTTNFTVRIVSWTLFDVGFVVNKD